MPKKPRICLAGEARPLPKRGFFPMRMGAQISTPNDGYPDYTTVWETWNGSHPGSLRGRLHPLNQMVS